MNNPISRTRMERTKDRIQHYSLEARECFDCNEVYYPKIHSQPYVIQFGIIFIGISIVVLLNFVVPAWLYALIPLPILLFMVIYYLIDRKSVYNKMSKVKYGNIVIECPKCGEDKV